MKQLEGHEYDGIQELDNQLPRWWLASFYITVLFSLPYFVYYVAGDGPTLVQEYEREQAQIDFRRMSAEGAPKTLTVAELKELVANPELRTRGQGVFQSKCASCHGGQAQGGIGPNLTDAYWLHGGKLTDIVKTIQQGVPEKGMPPWGTMLAPTEVQAVLAYVHSRKGAKVEGGKAPQGELTQEE
jgi:cytochrome c oxidase cbb3-type subunit 3